MIKIKVIGVGGAGVNTLNRLSRRDLPRVGLVAVNTDAQSLAGSKIKEKIQIGPKLTKGLGAGGNPEIGRLAANESRQDLAQAIEGADLIFVTAGLSGGTGTGAGPTIARLAKEVGATVVAIVTTPFLFEGARAMARAEEGIASLEETADTVVVLPNQKLFQLSQEDNSLQAAFEKADRILIMAIKSITDLITTPGLINLDFAAVRTIVNKGGRGFFGFGQASGKDRVKKLVEETFSSSLLEDTDIKGAKACLVNIAGSAKLSIKEVNEIMEHISTCLDPKANIIFGVTIDSGLRDELRLTIISTGIKNTSLSLRKENYLKNGARTEWPDRFKYDEELDTPSFLRNK